LDINLEKQGEFVGRQLPRRFVGAKRKRGQVRLAYERFGRFGLGGFDRRVGAGASSLTGVGSKEAIFARRSEMARL